MGNTGSPSQHALLEESAIPSEAGPEAPARGWSGGEWCSDVPAARSAPRYHPSGPVGPLALPVPGTLGMPPPGHRGEIKDYIL